MSTEVPGATFFPSTKFSGAAPSAVASVAAHAFKISTQTTPASGPPTVDRIVELRSKLLKALAPLATMTITGLGTVDEPSAEDGGWALLIANDLIWLEVDCDAAGEPASAAIKSYGAGDEWPAFEGGQSLVEWTGSGTFEDPFVQTKARAVIARAPADGTGAPRLVQVLQSDLMLVRYAVDGKVLYILEPFNGAVA